MSEPKSIDTYEAKALSAHKNLIDIYSCSWGPSGGVRGPGPATKIILKRGAEMVCFSCEGLYKHWGGGGECVCVCVWGWGWGGGGGEYVCVWVGVGSVCVWGGG